MNRIARFIGSIALPAMLILPAAAFAQSSRTAEPEGEKTPAAKVTDDSFKCTLDMTT